MHLETLNNFYGTAHHAIQQNFFYEQQIQHLIRDNQTFLRVIEDKDSSLDESHHQVSEGLAARERLEWDLKEQITLRQAAENRASSYEADRVENAMLKEKMEEANGRYTKLTITHRKLLAHCLAIDVQLPADLEGLPSPEAGMITVLKALHQVNRGLHSTMIAQNQQLVQNTHRIEFLEHWTGVVAERSIDSSPESSVVEEKRARSASPVLAQSPRKSRRLDSEPRRKLRLRIKTEPLSS